MLIFNRNITHVDIMHFEIQQHNYTKTEKMSGFYLNSETERKNMSGISQASTPIEQRQNME